MTPTQRRGQSLAELLVCLLIIAVLAGLLLPPALSAYKATKALKDRVEGR
jgi:prepilin-type N-terminal cleavage/methylation domain-containing protein